MKNKHKRWVLFIQMPGGGALQSLVAYGERMDAIHDAIVNKEWTRAEQLASDEPRSYFKSACWTGKLEDAKWLVDTFSLRDDSKLDAEIIFIYACDSLNMAKWLVETFPSINVRALDDWALRFVIDNYDSNADAAVIHWMFGFYTAEEFWSDSVQTLCADFLTNWRAEVEPRRRQFMSHIAPLLEIRARKV